jgi:hypothetical protein
MHGTGMILTIDTTKDSPSEIAKAIAFLSQFSTSSQSTPTQSVPYAPQYSSPNQFMQPAQTQPITSQPPMQSYAQPAQVYAPTQSSSFATVFEDAPKVDKSRRHFFETY